MNANTNPDHGAGLFHPPVKNYNAVGPRRFGVPRTNPFEPRPFAQGQMPGYRPAPGLPDSYTPANPFGG